MAMQQMIRPILLRHYGKGGSGKWKSGLMREGKWIIVERILSTTEGGSMPQPTQQSPLMIEPQMGKDKGILIAKMNVPKTKNALSRSLVQQVCI